MTGTLKNIETGRILKVSSPSRYVSHPLTWYVDFVVESEFSIYQQNLWEFILNEETYYGSFTQVRTICPQGDNYHVYCTFQIEGNSLNIIKRLTQVRDTK